jgi:plasmid maintenance system killer protein
LNIRPKSANNRDLRPLTDADASEFQRLRLQGLQESPSSFGSSHEEEAHKTPDQVQQHIAGSVERVFLGLFTGTELVGMVGVGREQGLKERHIAFIRSMYVAPQARGQGAGQQLLAAALQQAWSWEGVEQVTLSVTASNDAAKSPEALNVPGFDFHGLQGKPKRYSVHVNGPWCITFEWQGENAVKVDRENYH